jgi:hypothetical protein
VRVERDVLERLEAVARRPRAVRPRRLCGSASSAIPASSFALSRILAVALEIAAVVPGDGLVLNP